jgi:hypothetical protein
MKVKELRDGLLWLGKNLYSEEATSERRNNFKRMLKTSINFKGGPQPGIQS